MKKKKISEKDLNGNRERQNLFQKIFEPKGNFSLDRFAKSSDWRGQTVSLLWTCFRPFSTLTSPRFLLFASFKGKRCCFFG